MPHATFLDRTLRFYMWVALYSLYGCELVTPFSYANFTHVWSFHLPKASPSKTQGFTAVTLPQQKMTSDGILRGLGRRKNMVIEATKMWWKEQT